MDDNFNTAGALAVLFGFLDYTTEFMNLNEADRRIAFYFSGFLFGELCYCLGVSVKKKDAKIGDTQIMKKIDERIKAKTAGDFKKADKIRDELLSCGIILEDTKDKKTIYRRR
jgi:cysteinyl-tRNA synthetase